jgi:uncharacterized SAM-binding protein YcdF (DUF218 family)
VASLPGTSGITRTSGAERPAPSLGGDFTDSIVVLGCRVLVDGAGGLAESALARRVAMGAIAYHGAGPGGARGAPIVIVSGGRRWGEHVEADAMAIELARRSVPPEAIVRERCSLSTRENARFTAELLVRRGVRRATLVTCHWHMDRAVVLFSRAGIEVHPVPAWGGAYVSWPARLLRWGRERVLTRLSWV